jgi:hypothetical protein
MSNPDGTRAGSGDAELKRLIREHELDKKSQAAGRTGAIAKTNELDDLDVGGVFAQRGAGAEDAAVESSADFDDAESELDDADDAGSEPAYHVDAPGRRPATARTIDEAGTARDGARHLRRELFRRHLERLTIIDPFAAAVAAMRWLPKQSLTIPQIMEMTGRAKSTIEGDLQAAGARMALLNRFAAPVPVVTYTLARKSGLPLGAAGFAFWFAYTLSAERAAELSGYGRGGATAARKHVLSNLAESYDPRVRAWSASLNDMIAKLKSIRERMIAGASAKIPSTTLGKRRSALHPEAVQGGLVTSIPWLEQIADDFNIETVKMDTVELERNASLLRDRTDGDPVARLANALEHDSANVVSLALELVSRDMPYFDAFRDP